MRHPIVLGSAIFFVIFFGRSFLGKDTEENLGRDTYFFNSRSYAIIPDKRMMAPEPKKIIVERLRGKGGHFAKYFN